MPKKGKEKKGRSKKKKSKSRSREKKEEPEEESPLPLPNVFLIVRRLNTTIFLEGHDEEMRVHDVISTIAAIGKVDPEEVRLFYEKVELNENMKKLKEYGINPGNANPTSPANLSSIFKIEGGGWEEVNITPYSPIPEVPEELRPKEEKGEKLYFLSPQAIKK